MRHKGHSLSGAALFDVHRHSISASGLAAVLVGIVLLTGTTDLVAQHGGGRGTRSRPFICIYDCRDPGEGDDLTRNDLKKFDQLMAVQATVEQKAAFSRIQQDGQTAATQLKTFRQLLEKNPTASPQPDNATLDQVLHKARTDNRTFLASLSAAQNSGLKDLIKRMADADSDLGKEITALNGLFQAPPTSASIASVAGDLDKALASFQSQQMALAREMSILPREEQDLTFHLVQVTTSAEIAGQQVSMPAAGEAIRTSVTDGRSLFNLRLVVDLSDLQDKITDIFRSRLTSVPRCGERIEVRQAMLLPQSAASLAVLQLHHERWICPPGAERASGGEFLGAEGNADVEIKLRPSADSNGELHLVPELGHIEADVVFRDSLLAGPLGGALAGQASNLVLSAMLKGADLKAALPPAAQDAVTIQKVQFQAGSAGELRLVLDGQLRFTEEQTQQFAAQLEQQLSSQAKSP